MAVEMGCQGLHVHSRGGNDAFKDARTAFRSLNDFVMEVGQVVENSLNMREHNWECFETRVCALACSPHVLLVPCNLLLG